MAKLNFNGNNSRSNSNFEPSIKEYAPKNGDNPNSLANLMMDGKITADQAKALKAAATQVMDVMKSAGHPTNVTYQAYDKKTGEIGFKLSVRGRDSKEGELQSLDMTLDKDMKITKAFSTKTEQVNGHWKTDILKGSEYNNFMKNARAALKDLLPAAPARELPPFVKEISDKIREASPKMQNKEGQEVAKYYTTLQSFKDKNNNDRTNMVVNTHGDEQLTITLNQDLDGITQLKYTDFSAYDKEKGNKDDIKNVVLDDSNLDQVRDTFLHDTVIGDILLSKDEKALAADEKDNIDMDFSNIPDVTIDEDEIPFN